MSIANLSVTQLRKAADLKEKIAGLEKQLAQILGSTADPASTPTPKAPKKKRGMSAAGKAKIRAAQKLRWAKVKSAEPVIKAVKLVKKARKQMSAAAKANLSALMKARWAARKAGKK